MSWETIIYEEIGRVARVTLNRPETHNVQNARLILELDEAVKKADFDPEIRVIILRGTGKSFSSGHDLSASPNDRLQQEFLARHRRSVEDRLEVEEEFYLEKCLAIRNLKKPTIAAIHGNVVLGGMMLAFMCDLVIAAENTRLWNPSLRHCGTGGEILVLPFEIGFRKAKEYLWTGDFIPIHEAERLGMVNRVVPDDQLDKEAVRLAERIALMPPVAVKINKRYLNKIQDHIGMSMAFEYHFAMHQLAHATKESADWHAEAAEHFKKKGFKGWLDFRDGPFDKQAQESDE
jgi:enoyl-CoA hydratase